MTKRSKRQGHKANACSILQQAEMPEMAR